MSDKRLGTLMVAMLPAEQVKFVGEVVGIADHPTLTFKAEREVPQQHWAAHLCRTATKDEQIEYWKARALREKWDGVTERRGPHDRRKTYGRRESTDTR